jgi:glyoxylase-like metal-dependent hydrolase (beta-lactamase superfamily II)
MKRFTTFLCLAATAAGACFLLRPKANAQTATPELSIYQVRENLWALFGAGGNITIQKGDDGVLLVDSGLAQNADQVLAEIRKLVGTAPLRFIVNTHAHPDHVGGNEKIGQSGASIAGGTFAADIADAGAGANILAHENVLNRMSAPTGKQAPFPTKAWPNNTYFTSAKKMYLNGEGIEVIHIPNAHTDGDSLVYFRRSDVISAGDLYVTTSYPLVDLDQGGSIQGILMGLNRMIDMSIPQDRQEGGTYIIPGHGRICDQADLVEYRDMTTIIRDRIQDLVKRGLTLNQVKAARPTLDYDGIYGSATGFWTTDKFVEAVYAGLAAKK